MGKTVVIQDLDLYRRFKVYCAEHDISITRAIAEIVRRAIEQGASAVGKTDER